MYKDKTNQDDYMEAFHRDLEYSPKITLKEKQEQVPKDKPKQDEDVKHFEKSQFKRNHYQGDDFFLMKRRREMRNPEFRKLFNGITMLYDWLWCNIVRGKMKGDKLNIYDDYYVKRNLLAYSASYRQLAKDLFCSVDKVRRYIERLDQAGVIKIETKNIGKDKPQNIYILGYWKLVEDSEGKTIKKDFLYMTKKFGQYEN